MKKLLSVILAAGLLASGASAALAQTKGDWVLGNYKGAGYWFPGKIASLAGEKIGIAYDDGDKETTRTGRCRSH